MEFHDARVTACGRTMVASTFGGVPPTPAGGITAAVVHVRAGTAADFAAADDVAGKIVLIDAVLGSRWMDLPWSEATLQGAVGIIYTSARGDDAYFADPAVLGSFDAEYNFANVPVVFLSGIDGTWLEDQVMANGTVTATMVNDVDYIMAGEGGVGYNVLGELPGRAGNGPMVVISAHHDGYFYSGLDDFGGVVSALTMAKAMRLSDYQPQHTIVLMLTTGEEFGRVNSHYDWLIGSWYAITHTHADWPGKVAAQINLETQAMRGASLALRCNPELNSLVDATLTPTRTMRRGATQSCPSSRGTTSGRSLRAASQVSTSGQGPTTTAPIGTTPRATRWNSWTGTTWPNSTNWPRCSP